LLQPAIDVIESFNQELQNEIIDGLFSFKGVSITLLDNKELPLELLYEYLIHNIPESDFQNFFLKLINEYFWKKRLHTQSGSTPISLISFISQLIETKDGQLIFDPFVGKGSLVAELSRNKTQKVVG